MAGCGPMAGRWFRVDDARGLRPGARVEIAGAAFRVVEIGAGAIKVKPEGAGIELPPRGAELRRWGRGEPAARGAGAASGRAGAALARDGDAGARAGRETETACAS
jgi:hypothetical protein